MKDVDLCDVEFFTQRISEPFWQPSRGETRRIFQVGKHPVFLGGEHLESLPLE